MSEQKNIMEYETVALDEERKEVVILDQTKLPRRTELIRLKSAQEIWEAIYLLKVRGAPAIGVAAALGFTSWRMPWRRRITANSSPNSGNRKSIWIPRGLPR